MTKGASNRYGNSRGSRGKGIPSNHINYQWAKDFNKNTLKDHFNRHGKKVGASTEYDYVQHAINFSNTVDRKNVTSFVDYNGSTYKYNKLTNELAIITSDGYVITYYKPKNGYDYYKSERRKNKR